MVMLKALTISDTNEQRSLKAHFSPSNDASLKGFKILALVPLY